MNKITRIFVLLVTLAFAGIVTEVNAATTCTFTTSGSTMVLNGDCTTDATILIPDGVTLDGDNNSITAIDPPAGHFVGAVVKNGGLHASVINLTITTLNLANSCDALDDRLRGILFDNASGIIHNNIVVNLNQGASGCQEGNAIEVRDFNLDLTTSLVEISFNDLSNYQKSGIVANGEVDVNIHHNKVGASATQANLAANSIQLGFGAKGKVEHNQVAGNSWCCADAAATAILLYQAAVGSVVRLNNIMDGNADVGIYIFANNVIVDNNRVFESGVDGYYDIGIGDYGTGNSVTNNKIRGFNTPIDGVPTGTNKVIPSPRD